MSTNIQESPIALIVPQDSGLEIESVKSLETLFAPFFTQAEEWRQKALACKVTDVNDKRGMKFARESRLALREIRIAVEKSRKKAKEDSLRRGKAIDGMANVFNAAVEPIEAFLLEQEQYAERVEAERISKLTEERRTLLEPYGISPLFNVATLGTLSEEDFQTMLADSKAITEARVERERKAEADRIAKEKAEAAERERIRLENEQLKREASEREEEARKERERIAAERKAEQEKAAAEAARVAKEREAERQKAEAERRAIEEKSRKEREAIEAKARAEREAAAAQAAKERAERERLEAEIKAKKDAEAKAKAAEAKRAAAALRAPDKEKLLTLAKSVRNLSVPALSTDEARAVGTEIAAKIEGFAKWIEKQAQTLELELVA